MALVINGERVPDELLSAELEQLTIEIERGETPGPRPDLPERLAVMELMDTATNRVVEKTLVRQEAARNGPPVTDEMVERAFKEFVEEAGGSKAFFKRIGGKRPEVIAEIKRGLRDQVRVEETIGAVIDEQPPPPEEALRAFYEDHPKTFTRPSALTLCQIVNLASEDPASRSEAEERTQRAWERVAGGEDFGAVAEELSDVPKLARPDTFDRGQLPPEFLVLVDNLEPGSISEPWESASGFQFAQLVSRQGEEVVAFEEVREEIRSHLALKGYQKAYAAFIERLKAGATIERDGDLA